MPRFGLIGIIIIIFIAGCATQNGFEDYRFNPFQFPYSEYYLTAINIQEAKKPQDLEALSELNVFGVKIRINKNNFDEVIKNKDLNTPFILKKNNTLVLLANYHQDSLMGCKSKVSREAHKDFCSAFNSSKEFNKKLFTLTPNDINNPAPLGDGDLWIIHKKGYVFEQTEAIYIYELDNLTAFRQDLNSKASGDFQIHIFPKKISPNAIEIIVFGKNVSLIDEILYSINKS
ncbi:MAG: hypothetical protein GY699_05405 [Desulfobacteraceae bacterium]|nr:hypothetical protein [Desulfobacteraceae bacterium]